MYKCDYFHMHCLSLEDSHTHNLLHALSIRPKLA
jgi:hypothetical protein